MLDKSAFCLRGPEADGLQHPKRAQSIRIGGVFRRLEGDLHVRLRRQIVNLVRLGLLHDADDIGRVGHVAVAEMEGNALLVRIRG
jgi:hypothetical protein